MFKTLLNWFSGNYNEKKIREMLPLVEQANYWFAEYEALTDEDFPKKTQEFKDRIAAGETTDQLLPEAFGLVKQACKKLLGREITVRGEPMTWDMVPYDVQLLGGIVLHKGIISEMKTGEGKTLVAVAPVYLNALEGKGVHVVTVNDYLASRDSDWMSYVYRFLGMTVGCVTKKVSLQGRRELYGCDITYVENSELGFDFLRDNLVKTMGERSMSWRPMHYAIVDEIDSILIDEARTPLIISEASEEATEKYAYYAQIVRMLTPCSGKQKISKGLLNELLSEKEEQKEEDGDYYIDEKTKTVAISGRGIQKLEAVLKVENLYRDIGYEEIHHMENALKAQAVYQLDTEYIVVNGEVLIVDEHTGRTMPGRRFSEGLHQAIEAKEGVHIQRESKTLATITYQNFFKQYKKLAGMTGTATTEGEEFEKIYDLSVLEIPTNKPTIRVDRHDKVYFNQSAKWRFVKEYIKFAHSVGQPILIGTSSIETSESVSRILEKENIVHYVLNAKFHEQEAHIVAQAGKLSSVVVATNMAGRGTDIKLEKGLNEKVADNYADWIMDQVAPKASTKQSPVSVSAVVYSSIEADLTIDGLMRRWKLTEDQIQAAQKGTLSLEKCTLRIVFNKKKKSPEDAFAEFKIAPIGTEKPELIEKDFHYGLFILGTEKHESRRIDNQLRGRAGRQGDPGVSVFFVALDDLIMRKMGGERIQSMASMLLKKDELESLELTQKQFTSSIVRSQKQMEAWHFGIRKHVFEYDSVINKQRQAIYKKRDEILMSESDPELQKAFVEKMLADLPVNIADLVAQQVATAQNLEQSIPSFLEVFTKELGLSMDAETLARFSDLKYADLASALEKYVIDYTTQKYQALSPEVVYHVMREIYLFQVDTLWMKHIDEMEYLRDKVGLMGYAQIDPLVIYKKEAFEKFQSLLWRLKADVTTFLVGVNLTMDAAPIQVQSTPDNYVQMLEAASKQSPKTPKIQKASTSSDDVEVYEVGNEQEEPISPYARIFEGTNQKARPNDPCPCGSGKKYKKCCGA
ncbi:MAG: preprotein translocase subunit SecA [Candidatus Absconditabacteria bacterium]